MLEQKVLQKNKTHYGKYTFSVSVGILHPNCYTVHAIHIHHLGNPKSHIYHPIYTFYILQFHLIKELMLWPACHQLWYWHEHSNPCDELFCIFVLFGSKLQFATLFYLCALLEWQGFGWNVVHKKLSDRFYLMSLLHIFLYEI